MERERGHLDRISNLLKQTMSNPEKNFWFSGGDEFASAFEELVHLAYEAIGKIEDIKASHTPISVQFPERQPSYTIAEWRKYQAQYKAVKKQYDYDNTLLRVKLRTAQEDLDVLTSALCNVLPVRNVWFITPTGMYAVAAVGPNDDNLTVHILREHDRSKLPNYLKAK